MRYASIVAAHYSEYNVILCIVLSLRKHFNPNFYMPTEGMTKLSL